MSQKSLSLFSLVVALGAAGCAQQTPPVTAATPPPPPAHTAVTPGQELGAALRNHIQIDFGPGSDRLGPDADQQLDVAVRLFRDVRPVRMFSIGYSDAKGDEFANLLLAARRARAVKTALVARGIPADQIQLRSYGQSDPIDRADPEAPANRRVMVTWEIF